MRYEVMGIEFSPVLWLNEISFLYSPTAEASVDIAVPVWHWASSDVVLGDVTVDFRGVVLRDEKMLWRVVMFGGLRLPTGVTRGSAGRRIEGVEVSYFPYSRGALGWRGGVIGSFLGWPVWLHGVLGYISEYNETQTLLDFDPRDDGVFGQFIGDSLFRVGWGRILVGAGVLSWLSGGGFSWGSGVRLWQKTVLFFDSWRVGYEVSLGGGMDAGLFVQYNF
ncbi:hypothetical protein [Thermospira aquatica]|uniref:Uncharacterized protein n=1 Tax=Thermospira aquatica TaxID=2828656 RepID=A0AAX3BAW9_9SPIR|nr:hypothetical protein [Thermospira aquatica]URA09398.1 hypothetical protein KDW03_07840 [Thermospira aquatica]